MEDRKKGLTQKTSAAKAGFSERSGRRIDKGELTESKQRHWKTRQDPLMDVWEAELVPMLKSSPELAAITLLEYLQEKYVEQYPDKLLRTLQRRVKQWKAINGPNKEVMFSQVHEPGRQGLSDFTKLKQVTITIQGEPFPHLLYHFRLAYSRWSYMKVIRGGESYTALTTGLQEALWRLGGCPEEHRTDSLSAAYKNLSSDEATDFTERYRIFCQHYGMKGTRNNPGCKHENGSVESPHGHIKRRIKQALLLRGCTDFASVEAYQRFIDDVVSRHNKRNASAISVEREHLLPLPEYKTSDFTEVVTSVTSTSTITIKHVIYSVPSRLIGETLRIHIYDSHLECYLGATHVITLPRIYTLIKQKRSRCINYKHLIDSLVKKPFAFYRSRIRDDILPNQAFKMAWDYLDKNNEPRIACKIMVGLLKLAADHDCEDELTQMLLELIQNEMPPDLNSLRNRFEKPAQRSRLVTVKQHSLKEYDQLCSNFAKEASNERYS